MQKWLGYLEEDVEYGMLTGDYHCQFTSVLEKKLLTLHEEPRQTLRAQVTFSDSKI